jgi:Protein of unknown function (DUF4239)
MISFLQTLMLLALLMAASQLGLWLQTRLHERHFTRDSVESVRLVATILATFTAIVLGLLLTATKSSFDANAQALRTFSAQLIELDAQLREYGADAEPIRGLLRRYTAAAIADTWPSEAASGGTYPHSEPRNLRTIESSDLTELLTQIDVLAMRLAPADAFHQRAAARINETMAAMMRTRWMLIESAGATIDWPFLIVLMLWLAVIFLVFALTSPRHAVMQVVIALSALSLASVMYVILELDTPFSGTMMIPSTPLRDALAHIDRPAGSALGEPATPR